MATFFSPADQGFQPKRKFRFLVNFSNLGADSIYMVTKAAKPSFELSNSTEHRILNHTFKYPGIVKWTDIDITLLDAFEPNIGSKFYNVLRNMGYIQPKNQDNLAAGITKSQAQATLGDVVIKQLDAGGTTVDGFGDGTADVNTASNTKYYEEWTLKNAFLKSVKFGDLAYDDEGLVTIDIGISYDFATYTEFPQGITV